MTILLIALLGINTFIFYNQWKKLFYLLIIVVPYLGYLQLHTFTYTILAPISHDFIFIIPLVIIFIASRKNLNILPLQVRKLVFLLIILLSMQFFNPVNELNFAARLVGLKIWIFYFFCIFISYHAIEDKNDLKKFCNVFAVSAIIPCVIGIAQYFLSLSLGHQRGMGLFYLDPNLAFLSTQNYASFIYGPLTLFRIPSTFSYVAQYLNFILAAFVPIITSIYLSSSLKEKKFYTYILILASIGAFLSGNRSAGIFLPIFIIFFYYQERKFMNIKFFGIKTLVITGICLIVYNNFYYAEYLTKLGFEYITEEFFYNLTSSLTEFFFGNGLGSKTSGARYVDAINMVQLRNEGYYWKVIVELGVLGLFLIVSLFFSYLHQTNLVKKKISVYKEKVFCSAFYAYCSFHMIAAFKSWVTFDGYPTNFIFFIFLGIIFKLGSKEYFDKSYLMLNK